MLKVIEESENVTHYFVIFLIKFTQPNFESAKWSFRINYFLYIVHQATGPLKRKLEQNNIYEEIFGFLFSIKPRLEIMLQFENILKFI